MAKDALRSCAAFPENPHYDTFTARLSPRPHSADDDIRSPFMKDYTRILHSLAYRRLKHKTQVFFNVSNDHICTRIEHVSHVESVSNIIATHLGLNTELTRAIATGHDLGHAPFGHEGEYILKKLSMKYLGRDFWHEQNGVRFADKIELLEDKFMQHKNMNLTYAVRDGIICHCGEIDESHLFPRADFCSLDSITSPGQVQPATWEGCVVKLSDKIGYLGRDIADAVALGVLGETEMKVLSHVAKAHGAPALNTTVIIDEMISDVCEHSSPERGITMSEKHMTLLNDIKRFNYANIYNHPRLLPFRRYAALILTEMFEALMQRYAGPDTVRVLFEESKTYPMLFGEFARYIAKYTALDISEFPWGKRISDGYVNEKIYGNLETKELYAQAVLDYLSGMTDSYAIRLFQELINI